MNDSELKRIISTYKERDINGISSLYSPFRYEVLVSQQEKLKKLVELLAKIGVCDLKNKKILEIGCGSGNNLLELIWLGAEPSLMFANDLVEERCDVAKVRLPNSVNFFYGDASVLNLDPGSFDVIYQSMVFSSILDAEQRKQLANKMWYLLKPGGIVIWYDFMYNNPMNPNVLRVTARDIQKYFPGAKIQVKKVTLAPLISRRFTQKGHLMINLLNLFSFLRTHLLATIQKPL